MLCCKKSEIPSHKAATGVRKEEGGRGWGGRGFPEGSVVGRGGGWGLAGGGGGGRRKKFFLQSVLQRRDTGQWTMDWTMAQRDNGREKNMTTVDIAKNIKITINPFFCFFYDDVGRRVLLRWPP